MKKLSKFYTEHSSYIFAVDLVLIMISYTTRSDWFRWGALGILWISFILPTLAIMLYENSNRMIMKTLSKFNDLYLKSMLTKLTTSKGNLVLTEVLDTYYETIHTIIDEL